MNEKKGVDERERDGNEKDEKRASIQSVFHFDPFLLVEKELVLIHQDLSLNDGDEREMRKVDDETSFVFRRPTLVKCIERKREEENLYEQFSSIPSLHKSIM